MVGREDERYWANSNEPALEVSRALSRDDARVNAEEGSAAAVEPIKEY